jgi:hypothetical protein
LFQEKLIIQKECRKINDFGTSAVMILYIAVNFVYLNALDRDGIAFAVKTG